MRPQTMRTQARRPIMCGSLRSDRRRGRRAQDGIGADTPFEGLIFWIFRAKRCEPPISRCQRARVALSRCLPGPAQGTPRCDNKRYRNGNRSHPSLSTSLKAADPLCADSMPFGPEQSSGGSSLLLDREPRFGSMTEKPIHDGEPAGHPNTHLGEPIGGQHPARTSRTTSMVMTRPVVGLHQSMPHG